MTTTMTAAPVTGTAAAPGRAEPRPRFRDLLAAEWTKLWSLRSIRWALGGLLLAALLANGNAARSDMANYAHYSQDLKEHYFSPYWVMRDCYTSNAGWITALLAGAIGAIAIVGEYSTGMIRTTFAAVPARRSVLAAKAAVLTALMSAAGLVMSFGSFFLVQAIMSEHHQGVSLSREGVLRCVLASAALPVVCALVGFGLGALIRHSATTMIAVTAVLLLLPNLVNAPDKRWVTDAYNALPIPAWERLAFVGSRAQLGGKYPATIDGSWVALLVWSLAAVVVPLLVVRRRDV
ncbi:ABC transporter permease [Kitasatospora sp. LaBMicrA B282]|uniref:ABC transporter permease n=1 Tax=Kitasatospora sp. LaBMicrA B282 TaxID=3420949 RepID=UPI003D0C7E2C